MGTNRRCVAQPNPYFFRRVVSCHVLSFPSEIVPAVWTLGRRDVKMVHELYFPLQPSKDVAFEIGRIFMGLKDFDSAAELFRYENPHQHGVFCFDIAVV